MQHLFSLVFLKLFILNFLPTDCQQFGFNNNAPAPPRFLIPGAFAAQNQPQPKRLVQNPENEAPQRPRRPIQRARVGGPPPSPPIEPEYSPSPTSPRSFPIESTPVPPRPVVEDDDEAEEDSQQQSTVTPPINTNPPKTFRPSTPQFRPTKAFFGNTNIIDEEEGDIQTTRSQTSNLPTTVQETPTQFLRKQTPQLTTSQDSPTPFQRRIVTPPPQAVEDTPVQFQRKQTPRIQPNFRPQSSLQQEIVENKISRQFEKPIKPKFVNSEASEKRVKKPVAQVLRRYREDNADGSITWGFENDDGSFKEERIGNDCVTRGKYGYIDPDGVKREYSYASGLPCDPNRLQEAETNNSGYVDYAANRVVLPNGDSVDLDHMVKNRARKPVSKFRN